MIELLPRESPPLHQALTERKGPVSPVGADDTSLFAPMPIPEVPQALAALDPLLATDRNGDGRRWDLVPRAASRDRSGAANW